MLKYAADEENSIVYYVTINIATYYYSAIKKNVRSI